MSYCPRIVAISYSVLALFALGEAIGVGAGVEPSAHLTPLPTTIDASCRERFMKEALPAWTQLNERLRGHELKLTFLDHRPEDKEHDGSQWSFTYCRRVDGVSRQLHRDDKVDVTNSRYSFKVSPSDNGYYLSERELWQRGGSQPLVGWIEDIESKLAAGSSVWYVPLATVVADKAVRTFLPLLSQPWISLWFRNPQFPLP